MTRGLCVAIHGFEFVRVNEDNKQDVLDFLHKYTYEIADIVYSDDADGKRIYTLLHQDPDYNPYQWGYVGDYLVESIGEYQDRDVPQDVPARIFEQAYLAADGKAVFYPTEKAIREHAALLDRLYDEEHAE